MNYAIFYFGESRNANSCNKIRIRQRFRRLWTARLGTDGHWLGGRTANFRSPFFCVSAQYFGERRRCHFFVNDLTGEVEEGCGGHCTAGPHSYIGKTCSCAYPAGSSSTEKESLFGTSWAPRGCRKPLPCFFMVFSSHTCQELLQQALKIDLGTSSGGQDGTF